VVAISTIKRQNFAVGECHCQHFLIHDGFSPYDEVGV
jgi:hypothetical protein